MGMNKLQVPVQTHPRVPAMGNGSGSIPASLHPCRLLGHGAARGSRRARVPLQGLERVEAKQRAAVFAQALAKPPNPRQRPPQQPAGFILWEGVGSRNHCSI